MESRRVSKKVDPLEAALEYPPEKRTTNVKKRKKGKNKIVRIGKLVGLSKCCIKEFYRYHQFGEKKEQFEKIKKFLALSKMNYGLIPCGACFSKIKSKEDLNKFFENIKRNRDPSIPPLGEYQTF